MNFGKFLLVALCAVVVCGARVRNNRIGSALKGVGEVIFTPKALPCECIINRTMMDPDGSIGEIDFFYVAGNLFKNILNVPGMAYEEVLHRPDVRIPDPGSDKVYCPMYHCPSLVSSGCEDILLEEEALNDEIFEYLDWWYSNWTFINVTDGEFNGIPCKIYYGYEPSQQMDIYFCAKADNEILGGYWKSPDYSTTIYISYKYSAPLDLFVIDKGTFNDMNDTRAYVTPKENPCKVPSSSSKHPDPSSSKHPNPSSHSSLGVSSGAAFVIVLIAAVATVLFLF